MGLEASGLSMRFGGVAALQGVSLTAERGRILGVIGPNGSGKTTLLNVISGAITPTDGSAHLDGRRLTGRPVHQVARIGVARTFQNIRLFRDLTLAENVLVGARSTNRVAKAREKAREVIAVVGLESWADRIAGTLPYGVQRRAEIARALALGPAMLLLDEPAAGLDENESEHLLHMIRDLVQRYGCGIVIVDHDMRLIMGACHRVVVLNEGKKIAEGPPETVRNDAAVIEAYLE